ncbi:MAG: hypothetical protein HYY52_01930 [Candidatus Melainabacteria bacterium]|nr:hypothetical protein [Candidatus Melainabacteria bacterium]
MFNLYKNKELSWEIAYIARELRHKKKVTLSCLESETPIVLEQLGSFSSSNPITSKTINIPNSREVFLEIIN